MESYKIPLLKQEYQNNTFDEVYDNTGSLRSGYEKILNYFENQPQEKLLALQKRIQFVLKEQGVTFGEQRRDGYVERSWYLDIIPHIITEDEFERIQEGLKQRLTALNLFLQDVYSFQKILKDKIIPLRIVLGDKNYLRDCVNVSIPNGVYLHIGAFDILRDNHGNFIVLDDNVTIPSGVSYALINRQIMREQFPTLFNQMKIRQVWDTPSVILNRLRECAPKQIENPTIVLLTPGIYNEAYTEHELLASRMGIPLVMPKDLIVKENHVFMRTVTGLAKVDIIYRRIEDYFIDPVSFYQESVLGVPGLLSCVIHGNVTVANALGCGIASSKSLLPFMNKIIRYYLNEEPKLPTIETHLLSDEKMQKHIFENIEQYVIKPVHGTGGYGLSIGYELSEGQKNELQKKVSANPYHFIAQPVIQLSTSRIFNLANLEKRYVESRFFTFFGSSFSIANCALTRVSPTSSSLVVTNSRGGGSKDTWIIGESERKAVRFLVPLTKNRSKTFLLSRVAESLFWLGRYMYRSHITSRVLQVMFSSEIDVLIGKGSATYNSLLRTIARLTGAPIRRILNQNNNRQNWYSTFFHYVVFSPENPYSVKANLNYALGNAREIQNMLSNSMWTTLRKLLEYVENSQNKSEQSLSLDDLPEWLSGVVHFSQAFYGATLDTFFRQDTRDFIELGRYLEHCFAIVNVLRSTLQYLIEESEKEENLYTLQPFIIVILKFLNSYESYQLFYESRFDPYLAYRMVIYDREYNTSLVNCIEKIKSTVNTLTTEKTYDDGSPENICDMLISRTYSFDLKAYLGKEEIKRAQVSSGRKFFDAKQEVTPGFWTSDLKAGLEVLGNKIVDRYSNLTSTNSFIGTIL